MTNVSQDSMSTLAQGLDLAPTSQPCGYAIIQTLIASHLSYYKSI